MQKQNQYSLQKEIKMLKKQLEIIECLKSYYPQDDRILNKQIDIKIAQEFCNYLTDNNINYDICIKHREPTSCLESKKYYERFDTYLQKDYVVFKNLLVRERNGLKRKFLLITDSDKKIDLKKLRTTLEKIGISDCKKLEFSDEEELLKLLNTTKGNVSIFNIWFDKLNEVNIILDEDILNSSMLAFHPLYNGMSMFLSPGECFKFLELINRKAEIIKMPEKDIKIITKSIAS